MFNTIFITEENSADYKNKLFTWLESDFNHRGKPGGHFWHNKNIIADAFDNCAAMVVLNDEAQMIGYMIWNVYSAYSVEIDIVETRKEYRRKGVFTQMLKDFTKKFPDVVVLSASVIPESEKKFINMQWQNSYDFNDKKLFFKTIKPVLSPLDTLPEGHVIALFSKADLPADSQKHINFYVIRNHPDKYKKKYFKIDLDAENRLCTPIAIPFHYEGYVGIYYNKELIAEGKAKHLFANQLCGSGLLVMDQFEPIDFSLFKKKGFFTLNKSATSIETPKQITSCNTIHSQSAPSFFTLTQLKEDKAAETDMTQKKLKLERH